jgi:hypothetical protein
METHPDDQSRAWEPEKIASLEFEFDEKEKYLVLSVR